MKFKTKIVASFNRKSSKRNKTEIFENVVTFVRKFSRRQRSRKEIKYGNTKIFKVVIKEGIQLSLLN